MRQLAIALILLPMLAQAGTITGRVVSISDGDTLTMLGAANTQIKVRLAEIDAPEKSQPFGQASKKSLSDLCFDTVATVEAQGQDRYGRTIGTVMCRGTNANLAQIQRGMAWVYPKYARTPGLFQEEQMARASGIGLWADRSPTPPWEFRHK